MHLSLMDECRSRVEQALAVLGAEPNRNASRGMKLYAALATSLIYTGGTPAELEAAWAKSLELAERLDDTEYRLRAVWELWTLNRVSQWHRAALTHGSAAPATAEDLYRQALDWARRQGALSLELRAATSLARLLRGQGRSADVTCRRSSSRSTSGSPRGSTRPTSKRQRRSSTLSDNAGSARVHHCGGLSSIGRSNCRVSHLAATIPRSRDPPTATDFPRSSGLSAAPATGDCGPCHVGRHQSDVKRVSFEDSHVATFFPTAQ